MRIAMWSGPRNLSTAMMYSFAARADTAVWDEPFYAAYLAKTGLSHPMGREILAAGEPEADKVIARCLGPIPNGRQVFYQKHMTHHMIEGFDRGWMSQMTNVFLIRHPARVIASYAAKRENPTLDDIGFRQQAEIFDEVCQMTGQRPVVIDSFEIRQNPETALRGLCGDIGLGFEPAMLTWPKGPHADDGAWAPHWYGSVWNSTGFAGAEGSLPTLPDEFRALEAAALEFYQKLQQ